MSCSTCYSSVLQRRLGVIRNSCACILRGQVARQNAVDGEYEHTNNIAVHFDIPVDYLENR